MTRREVTQSYPLSDDEMALIEKYGDQFIPRQETDDMVEFSPIRRVGDLLPCPPDCEDQWWPASDDATPLVNEVALMVAHHHATGHLCGGGGFSADCENCDFAIEDGIVTGGGWVRFKKADDDG